MKKYTNGTGKHALSRFENYVGNSVKNFLLEEQLLHYLLKFCSISTLISFNQILLIQEDLETTQEQIGTQDIRLGSKFVSKISFERANYKY